MTDTLVYTSGTVPSANGTIPEGIEAQTVSSLESPMKGGTKSLRELISCNTQGSRHQEHRSHSRGSRHIVGARAEDDGIPRRHG